MEEHFWQRRWAEGKTKFHEPAPNRFLTTHFSELALPAGSHVFVPLCGKATDLDWLLAQGHRVTGIEFNRQAIEEVFDRLSLTPTVTEFAGLQRLRSDALTLWHGDLFGLTAELLGTIDAIYDRAALVALPAQIRDRYAKHLPVLTKHASMLLVTYAYDQSQTEGPPFSVPEQTVRDHYAALYDITCRDSTDIGGPLSERCSGLEQVWKLLPKTG